MDKKIRIMLSLFACATLLFVVVGTQIATGLTSSFWNNAADRVGGEVATSSRNIAVPDNCKPIGPYSELECRDDLTGSISIVIT